MTSPNDIGGRVLLAKIGLMLGNPGLGVERAGKLAARQVARELRFERQRQRAQRQAAPAQALSLSNATQHLIARLSRVFDRYLSREEQREPDAGPRPHTEDNAPRGELWPMRGIAGGVRKISDNTSVTGVWGNGPSGAQLLGDEQFHTSMHDRTTQNWRASLALNERVERERREAWAERKLVLKAKGVLQ
jgi:hypothetical protein